MKWAIVKPSRAVIVAVAMIVLLGQSTPAYSVLTHQAIIDSCWSDSIKPLLLKRFPAATGEQMREAHAFAYGGAIIQDMGYYPFGSKFYTDLTHYVRSGDFVEALLAEAQDLDEYAFALGALAHYAADNDGHSIGVNRAVPLVYPKLRARFGNDITYADDPSSHLRTEFGFDVVQVGRGNYAPEAYHDFIGFKVSKPVLDRAFTRTYGLSLKDVFRNLDLAIGTYRYTVSGLIPQMTKVAWELKKDDLAKTNSGITRQKFLYSLSRADYEKEFGKDYQKPGFGTRVLSWVIRILPKVGPLKPVGFKPLTPEAERLYMESFNTTLIHYRALLTEVGAGRLDLQNRDFDTGRATRAGEYRLADESYASLLDKLAGRHFENVSPQLQRNILGFYAEPGAPNATRHDRKGWRDTLRALDQLKAMQSQPAAANSR